MPPHATQGDPLFPAVRDRGRVRRDRHAAHDL